jgi:hypothetical protein
MELTNFKKASETFQIAYNLRKERKADPFDIALASANYGMALFKSGNDPNVLKLLANRLKAQSEKYLSEAWETYSGSKDKLSGERELEMADLALYRAEFEHSAGRSENVLQYFDKALEIKCKYLKSHPDVNEAHLFNLSNILKRLLLS